MFEPGPTQTAAAIGEWISKALSPLSLSLSFSLSLIVNVWVFPPHCCPCFQINNKSFKFDKVAGQKIKTDINDLNNLHSVKQDKTKNQILHIEMNEWVGHIALLI